MTPHCEPARFGATLNPWNTRHTTAGSSGGSAAGGGVGHGAGPHANDLGGSIRYPAACCAAVRAQAHPCEVPMGPEYGDPIGAMAVEHALTRTVRDSAAILDVISGPELGDPFPAPPRATVRRRSRRAPGRLRIAYCAVAADGHPTDPDCVRTLEDTVRLCEQLGHSRRRAVAPADHARDR